MAEFGYIVGIIAALGAALALGALAFWTGFGILPTLQSISERSGDAPGTAEIAEVRREIAALARRIEDVDEAADHRYRKLTARDRRAAAPKQPDAEADDDQIDLRDFIAPARGAAPNGRRLRRSTR